MDILTGNVPEVEAHVAATESLVELHQLRDAERAGKGRKGVLSAINDREAQLVVSPPAVRYRITRALQLGGRWVNRYTPERLQGVPQPELDAAVESGALEPITEGKG